MFVKINFVTTYDERAEVLCSTPNEAFMLINILNSADKVKFWNMEEQKPEYFGWMKGELWEKFRINFFSQEDKI